MNIFQYSFVMKVFSVQVQVLQVEFNLLVSIYIPREELNYQIIYSFCSSDTEIKPFQHPNIVSANFTDKLIVRQFYRQINSQIVFQTAFQTEQLQSIQTELSNKLSRQMSRIYSDSSSQKDIQFPDNTTFKVWRNFQRHNIN